MRDRPNNDRLGDRALEHELLTRTRELRSLARHLVGEQDAEDVLQESLTVALRRPPGDLRSFPAWMRVVLRRVASNHRRSERRRRSRETSVAQRGEALSSATLAEQRETLHRLTTAILGLEEPYRETITLRYFQDLRPSEIAARTGVPLATVKSRIQRGLARLRRELDTGDKPWRPSLALALGVPLPPVLRHRTSPPPTSQVLTQGALWMSKSTKSIVLVACLLVSGFAFLFFEDSKPLIEEVATEQAAASRVDRRTDEGSSPSLLTRQLAAPGSAEIDADLSHPHEFRLAVRILDSDGYPVEGAQIAVAPEGGAFNVWPMLSDRTGALMLEWWGRTSSTSIALGVLGTNEILSPRRLALRSGSTESVALLTIDPPTCGIGHIQGEIDCSSCHMSVESGLGKVDAELKQLLHPEATFSALGPAAEQKPDEVLDPDQEAYVRLTAQLHDPIPRVVGGGRVGFMASVQHRLARAREAAGKEFGSVEGRVYDASGQPVANALVTVGTEYVVKSCRTRTKADGSFELLKVPAGLTELRAVSRGFGGAWSEVAITADQTTFRELTLEQGPTLRGSVLGLSAEKAKEFQVEFHTDDGTWADSAKVEEDGTFILPSQPPLRGTLLLTRKEGQALPYAWLDGVYPDQSSIVLDPSTNLREGSLTLDLSTQEPRVQSGPFEVRIWHAETSRGLILGTAPDRRLEIDDLPAGHYHIEFGHPGHGFTSLPEVWVDGRGPIDLGILDATPIARLELPEGSGARIELYRRQAADDRFVTEVSSDEPTELFLPEGEWLLLGQDASGQLFGEELRLRADRTTVWRPGR